MNFAKLALACGALTCCIACSGSGGLADTVTLSVLSSRPNYVSGGDALVEVSGSYPLGSRIVVTMNGVDVSDSFVADSRTGKLVGRISGMPEGKSTLSAKVFSGSGSDAGMNSSLEVTNYPRTGPMFSGPHQKPFFCQTQDFALPDGSRLGAPLDANCSVTTRVDYVYRTSAATGASFRPLTSVAAPLHVATTTTSTGATVPYIVRLETGTINRAIYQTAVLHNPTAEPVPSFTAPPSGWNGRLVYTFGGGCTNGWYRQGSSLGNIGSVLDDSKLRQGYAIASSSLNVFGNNCNDLLGAETMAMVKERFIETYGRPRHTIGWGCSGGSYQAIQITDNYPGLLDGFVTGCTFPEMAFSALNNTSTDARLLGNYFRNKVPGIFTDDQQKAVAGFQVAASIYTDAMYNGSQRINPTAYCPSIIPADQRYDPVTNRTGVRCDVFDHAVNVYGKDPTTGFALRPLDNTGVQYGLQALNAGVISVDQFLDINATVGGYDVDGNFVESRTVGDVAAIRAAYQTGRLTNGGGGLRDVPIIDYRAYADDMTGGNVHLRFYSFALRDRLLKANGDADNLVMLHEDLRYNDLFDRSTSPLLLDALKQMDVWLANIAGDSLPGTQHAKVLRGKPATLQEGCMSRDATALKIVEKMERTTGQCAALYPTPAGPRGVAGGPISGDVIKCQLKPVALGDYTPTFTPAQQSRLRTVFPAGVCDWSEPGAEQQGLRGTWLAF